MSMTHTQTVLSEEEQRLLFAQIVDQYDPGDDAPEFDPGKPFILVENNERGVQPPYWITTWADENSAGVYVFGQEYPDDWTPIGLFHLRTGEVLTSLTVTATSWADGKPAGDLLPDAE